MAEILIRKMQPTDMDALGGLVKRLSSVSKSCWQRRPAIAAETLQGLLATATGYVAEESGELVGFAFNRITNNISVNLLFGTLTEEAHFALSRQMSSDVMAQGVKTGRVLISSTDTIEHRRMKELGVYTFTPISLSGGRILAEMDEQALYDAVSAKLAGV